MTSLRDFVPPVLKRLLLSAGMGGNTFRHGYKSWEDALAKAEGYDSEKITSSLLSAATKVRDGSAVYERDGVLFSEIQYSWPLLAALSLSRRESQSLRVLDWGGSLGSSYFQNKDLLESSGCKLDWTIVEQEHLVDLGKREFQSKSLHFSNNLGDFSVGQFDVAMFGGSICYIPNAEEILLSVKGLGPYGIIFDRTPEARGKEDLFGVQRVNSRIYKASYPIRSFGIGKLGELLSPHYRKIVEWESDLQPDPATTSKGYVFQKIS